MTPPALRPVRFEDIPGWTEDDPAPVIAALARSATHVIHVKPYRTGALGITSEDLAPAFRAALETESPSPAEARSFFETFFRPFFISDGPAETGFVTGYYEPEILVSRERSERFRFPIHARPDDLVDVVDENRPAGLDRSFAFARDTGAGLVEYADRGAIETGFLDGRGLDIAYAESRVDLFFVHIQGAARLVFPDGSVRRITYAAKTGHPFTPIGRLLIERGALERSAVTMETIRAWLAGHPDEVDALLRQNRSYIFFREAPVGDDALGPIAAAKVPLAAGRSLAVDRLVHTFGTPFFIDAAGLTHLEENERPFRRLMLAQDTGSAIVGPARGDIFVGSGADAGRKAGSVKHAATFFVLVPVAAAERLQR
ncbi:MAG: murein transglycosylase A [Pararhizobium sp.]